MFENFKGYAKFNVVKKIEENDTASVPLSTDLKSGEFRSD